MTFADTSAAMHIHHRYMSDEPCCSLSRLIWETASSTRSMTRSCHCSRRTALENPRDSIFRRIECCLESIMPKMPMGPPLGPVPMVL